MPRCLLALGANLGNRTATLDDALRQLARLPETQLLARSTWHETPAVGGPPDQPGFLNGAALLETQLPATQLAHALQAIEQSAGRERKIRWAARTLDIDLLLYGHEQLATAALTIPHPRMSFRRFVLAPAVEIAGHLVVPPGTWTLAALLAHLDTTPRRVAITAADPQLARWLTEELCRRQDACSTAAGDVCDWLCAVEYPPEAGQEPVAALPNLVIAVDRTCPGYAGPLAQLTATDPAALLDEALAALGAAWPRGTAQRPENRDFSEHPA